MAGIYNIAKLTIFFHPIMYDMMNDQAVVNYLTSHVYLFH